MSTWVPTAKVLAQPDQYQNCALVIEGEYTLVTAPTGYDVESVRSLFRPHTIISAVLVKGVVQVLVALETAAEEQLLQAQLTALASNYYVGNVHNIYSISFLRQGEIRTGFTQTLGM